MRTVHTVLGILGMAGFALTASALEVTNTRRVNDPARDLTVVVGQVEMPAAGFWWVVDDKPSTGVLGQVQLTPPRELMEQRMGRRTRDAEQVRRNETGQYPMWAILDAAKRYAADHAGTGPDSLAVLTATKDDAGRPKYPGVAQANAPWGNEPKVAGPYHFLVPGVRLPLPNTKPMPPRELLIVELHPYLDDGKHWVMYSDGTRERRAIDAAFCQKHGITITPVIPKAAGAAEAPAPTAATYSIMALVRDPAAKSAEVILRNTDTDARLTCTWSLPPTAAEDVEAVRAWDNARRRSWLGQAQRGDAPILTAWLLVTGDRNLPDGPGRGRARGPVHSDNAFGVLGGRAAVRETLQMDALREGPAPAGAAAAGLTPLADIKGVEVKSHPFEEMLAGKPGGKLAMADCVPPDRFFAYVPKPKAVLPFLDDGGQFLSQLGAMSTANCIDYDLKSRYERRLGVDGKWLRLLVDSGIVTEMAWVLPDLFFLEGTDLTVILRAPQLKRLSPLLAAVGVSALEEGKITTRALPSGQSAYWTAVGDLVCVSTHHAELDRILALIRARGEGSLGRTAEFRYMLTQLAPTAQTRAFLYLSDPFIRRLTGPEVKIGQLRRLQARAMLEQITGTALLYRYDAHRGEPILERLVRLGYLPDELDLKDYSLRPDGVAVSASAGTLTDPRSLLDAPVTGATPGETAAYRSYVENYSQYWRQYFDPIAFRLDDTADGALELTTFILPLVDNSLYNGLKQVLAGKGDPNPLRVPVLKSPGVVMLSLNLREESWVGMAKDGFSQATRLNPQILDYVGPGVHLVVQDSDPIVAFGSSDVLGAFDSNMMQIGRGQEMLMIPMVLSILTRPCTLYLEVKDPKAVRDLLRRGVATPPDQGRGMREFSAEITQYPGSDSWLYSATLFGMIRLRFGIELQDRFLVIRNLPWSQRPALQSVATAELAGARLTLHPQAVAQQLPALFVAESDRQRGAAFQGSAYLLPLMLTGAATPDAAAAVHRRLFGFAPVHPGTGRWTWTDGMLASDAFGTPARPLSPEYRASAAFGVFQDISDLGLNMQFEEAGLRAICRWTTVPAGK